MTMEEFDRWAEFYRRCPFDDATRYHRPAAVVAAAAARSQNPAQFQDVICPGFKARPLVDDGRLGDLADGELALLSMFGIGGK